MEEQASSGSKFIYVLLAVLFIGLIVGATAWFYLTGRNATEQTDTVATEPATTDPQTAGANEIDATLVEIDGEITEITSDEESDDDTIDY
jgi:hypothetical protein